MQAVPMADWQQQKKPPEGGFCSIPKRRLSLGGFYRYKRLVVFFLLELNGSIYQCKQGMVFTNAYVFTGVVFGAALANNDVPCDALLAAKNFNAQSFAF